MLRRMAGRNDLTTGNGESDLRSGVMTDDKPLAGKRRLLGLDYGDKTVGVAVSDPLGMTAQGVEIIRREKASKLRRTLARVEELAAEYGIEGVVLGLPLKIDGSEGSRCEKTRQFGSLLEKRLKLPLVYWDERLTTQEAYDLMREAGVRREKKRDFVDEIAAMIILQDFLSANGA